MMSASPFPGTQSKGERYPWLARFGVLASLHRGAAAERRQVPQAGSCAGSSPCAAADDDLDLLQRITDDDDTALRLFYARYSELVYSLAQRVLHDTCRAEEVLQETFIRIWRAAITYDPARGSTETWVVTIARNLAITALRNGHALESYALDIEIVATDDADVHAEQSAWMDERRQCVREAVARLPVAQRRIVMLSYFQGLTHAEIAASTGEPLGTVKSGLRLAIRHLEAMLGSAVGEIPDGEGALGAHDAEQL